MASADAELYAILAVVWIGSSLAGGALLALLAKRIHPALVFARLWLFYSGLLAVAVAAFFAIAVR